MTKTEAIAELSVLHERLSNPKDCEDGCYSWEDGWYVEAIDMAIEALSEPLTDKEQRIFLAAMGREEKVCKQVDDECRYCREPYEDSLVRTCHEITRKVKGALWTI